MNRTIKDLKIKRVKSKNEIEKNALMMLIDFTEKIAKEKNDPDVDKYLGQAVKKYLKQLNEEVNPNSEEVQIIENIADKILPKTLNKDETEVLIANILGTCNEVTKKCFGKVMGELKKRNDVDMKLASEILKNKL